MIDWSRFGELVIPGIIVGVFMLIAQQISEHFRSKNKLVYEDKWRLKMEAFTTAIRLVDQTLCASKWEGADVHQGHKPSGIRPTSLEINSAYARLMLTSESSIIPARFIAFFSSGSKSSPATRGEFIHLLRKELFYSDAPISADETPWVF